MGAAAPKPPLAIPPHSKLWGFLAFSRECVPLYKDGLSEIFLHQYNPTVRGNTLRYLAIIIILVALFARLIPGPRTIDDAYITFRYAHNILEGQGMVYNIGERVLGTTTPLYTLLMATFGVFLGGSSAPFPWISLIINALADGVTCLLLILLGRRFGHQWAGFVAASVWAIAPMSVTFAIGGMETSVFVTLMTGTFYFYSEDRLVPAAFLASLSLVTRPDSLLFILPLMVDRLRRCTPWSRINPDPAPISKAEISAFIIPSLLWFSFAALYYGNPLPNSLSAKVVAYNLQEKDTLIRLLQHYATPFLGHLTFGNHWIGFGLILYFALYVLGCFKTIRSWTSSWAIFIFPLTYLVAYSIANPLVFRWYLTPPLPIYFLGILIGLERLLSDLKIKKILFVFAGIVILLTLNGWTLKPDHGPVRPAPEMAFIRLELLYEQVGKELINDIKTGQVVAAGDIGAIGFFTKAQILDTVGLVTPVASTYYPLPESYYVINYAVSPKLILELKPDFLVILEVYGRNALLVNPDFNATYKLMKRYETDLYSSEDMLVFMREKGK